MDTLNDNRGLLMEQAKETDVKNCIRKRLEAEITYEGPGKPEEKGKGRRVIQPVCLGILSSGAMAVRAYQPMGDSKTMSERWKLFRLDRIKSWKTLWHNRFKEPPGADKIAEVGKFNENGDESMTQVLLVADFLQRKMKNNALMDFNRKRTEQKRDENPYHDLQQNVRKAKMATPDVQANINGWDLDKAKWQDDYDRAMAEREAQELAQYKGNFNSAAEMANTEDFGDKSYTETEGPQMKYADDADVSSPQNMNYDNVMNNGPVFKKDDNNGQVNYQDDSDDDEQEKQQ